MDANENAATKSLIERLSAKIPDQAEADFVRRSARAGEPALALTELLAILVDERVPVGRDDRATLTRLLERFGESADEVERLSGGDR